jgi:CBS domain-containing protein
MKRVLALTMAASAMLVATPAGAQEEPEVRLLLVGQTPFASPEDPFEVEVRASNASATSFDDLSLAVTVWSAARTRSDYAQVLDFAPFSPLGVKVFPLQGALGPGATRTFEAEWERLAFLAQRAENALYPVTVELRSADARLAELRSALVYVLDAPKVPLDVAACFVLDAPVRIRADGALLDTEIEEQILPGGRLDVIVGSLEETSAPVTVIVSPLLLEALADMRDGFRVVTGTLVEERPPEDPTSTAAGDLLDRLGEVARRTASTELVALPYASPSVPSIIEAGMDDDLAVQIERGRAVVEGVLGVAPSQTIFRPPASALTDGSLRELARILSEDGTTEALLVDDDAFPPPAGMAVTPHGAAEVAETALTAVTPDPVVEGRTAAGDQDPALAAMWTLGELSAIYFERPSIPRGVAVVFGEGERPLGRFLRVFLDGLEVRSGIRWLRGVKATRVAVGQPPPDDPTEPRELRAASRAPGFSTAVVAGLEEGRADVAALASMADQSPLLDQLRRGLLLAQSRYLAGHEPDRLSLIGSVRDAVAAELEKIHPPLASSITLTSRGGIIPVTLRNDAGYPVRVQLTLRSTRLQFVGGRSQVVRLERPVQQFVFPVRAQTTGRFPVRVELQTPDGVPIGSSRIVVRSTAYNRVALLVTAGAALFLALWWGRRLLSRRS